MWYFVYIMDNQPNSMPHPELPPDTSVKIEPELLARIELYVDFLKQSNVSQAELLLDFGMIDISVESVVNSSLRSFIEGVEESLHDDPSDA
jgi:hypothetical protein